MRVVSSVYVLFSILLLSLIMLIIGVFFRHSPKNIVKLFYNSGIFVIICSLLYFYQINNIKPHYNHFLFNNSIYISSSDLIILFFFLILWGISMIITANWIDKIRSLNDNNNNNIINNNKNNNKNFINSHNTYQTPYNNTSNILTFEIPGLLLLCAFILSLLILVNDMMTAYLAIEASSLIMYPIIVCYSESKNKRIYALEGVIKYFIFNGVMSVFYLAGVAMLYFEVNSINILEIESKNFIDNLNTLFLSKDKISLISHIGGLMILISISGKIGLAPLHFWTLDLYQSAPTFVMLFLSSANKIAFVSFFIKIFLSPTFLSFKIHDIIWTLSIISLVIGSLGGIMQSNIKRILAYSTIYNLAFISLIITSYGFRISDNLISSSEFIKHKSIHYTIIYFGAIAMPSFLTLLILEFKTNNTYYNINDIKNIGKSHPFIAFCLTILLLSMAGLPPFAGFIIKFETLQLLLRSEMYWTIGIILITSSISVFYYLRIISFIYFPNTKNYLVDKDKILQSDTNQIKNYNFSEIFLFFATMFNILYIVFWY
ncbi:NADH-quinone oxidoreductase subunit N [Lyticum sinuosum]|uniref:NADH-quinone oxidoreductase subunit N n=1 Tax=Lyticum sinuosum TaxID=1332059 RepID=A0AAE4VJW4_9RICK|nr:proton-conducting transporter membrane subunit [Lyticum sinuosum]MDZ5761320.1 NADH-quinone oxidoreductase subunit N [Lyticum sinuosum]